MKLKRIVKFRKIAALVALLATDSMQLEAAPAISISDTGFQATTQADPADRGAWKVVPSEMFTFEADPAKAASDPGYYGREYSFKGDAVVENRALTAIFYSALGRVAIYAKSASSPGFGKKVVELSPAEIKGKFSRFEVLRNASDEVVVGAWFSSGGAEASTFFSFGKDEIIEIKPSVKNKGFSIYSPIEFGIVPGFVGDDLIFKAGDATTDSLALPIENIFVGLVKGEDTEWVMTWPKGNQHLKWHTKADATGSRLSESVSFDNDGQSFYLAALNAPGIWHREALKPAFLEKDLAIEWKRPFPAKWKTQLTEAGVRTTFAFRESKGEIWRGVPGSYNYPVWFEGDKALFHLSKKVPPKGEALVYFLEPQETPSSVLTAVDVLKTTLGREGAGEILDVQGQKLRTHHRRGGDGVHRACTCGCTEAIQAIFQAKEEVGKKENVKEALEDMTYFVQRHIERIDEYRHFADDVTRLLAAKKKSAPGLKTYIENLEQTVQQIPQEYSVQKENMKSLEHASDLARQTMALTASQNTNNLAAYMELLKAWRAMGGAQDYVVAQCHMITRRLFQEAGYGCAEDPNAVPVAQEVRAHCRKVLRNPDGYEIWANY